MSRHTQRWCQLAAAAALALVTMSSAQAQRVVRDSVTGELRAPTADEAKAMDGKTGARQKAPVGMLTGKVNPQPIVHADGTVEQELDESTMMYSVVRRNPDGTLSTYCVHGPDQAHEVLTGKIPTSVAKVVKAAKEHKYEEK